MGASKGRERRPIATIDFRLSSKHFQYLGGLNDENLLKTILGLYHPIKKIEVEPEKGHYRVSLTFYRSDKAHMDHTLNHSYPRYKGVPHGFDWDKASSEDKYGQLISDLIWAYSETIEPSKPLSEGLIERLYDYQYKEAERLIRLEEQKGKRSLRRLAEEKYALTGEKIPDELLDV